MSDQILQLNNEHNLDELLEGTLVTQEDIEAIVIAESGQTIRDTLLSLGGPVGEAIAKTLNLNDKIDDRIKEVKKEHLLFRLYENNNRNEDILKKLRMHLLNPQFSILFNKLIRILNNSTNNAAYINELSLVLKNIVEKGDFSSEFEEESYILDQIEKLSPQAVILLADFGNWPEFTLQGPYEVNENGFVDSEWIDTFAPIYAEARKIQSDYRLNNIVRELLRNNLVRCYQKNNIGRSNPGLVQEAKIYVKCHLTPIGKEIAIYLANNKNRSQHESSTE